MASARLTEIMNFFHGKEEITWMKLLYDYNNGCYRGLIEIWTYFDRDYEGMTAKEADTIKEQMVSAFNENDHATFSKLLRQLPNELIDNGIGQTIDGFQRDHDDIDMSGAELEELDAELHRLHLEVVNGSIRIDAFVPRH